ncbi:hypothetical protein ACIBL3_39155 [Kribbella sp. NPDC050124]|uniref:hypothetical protein n=1 Tax=Kribbella sp. NPDC050124 TaxID=3364114 RepID=UPI0037B93C67
MIWFLMDPMYLFGSPSDASPEDRFSALDAALTTWGFGLVASLALAIFWYPSVEVSDLAITIRNPVRTIQIPLDAIDRIDDGERYVKVYANGKGYTCAGLETSLAMKMSTRDRNSTTRAMADLEDRPGQRSSTAQITRNLRAPSTIELGLFIVWVAAGALALLR